MRPVFIIARTLAIALLLAALPTASFAQVTIGLTVGAPPPPIPVYSVPPAPAPNYMWTPGYWGYNNGYYWVPGMWVAAPSTGMYWTPGYWGWNGNAFAWNTGYWGPTVGYYGGINYGAGYWGNGFYGGAWRPGGFYYNTAVWPVNRNVNNVYVDKTVYNNNYYNNSNHVSYNGGKGGTTAKPTPEQIHQRQLAHMHMTPQQQQAEKSAAGDKTSYAKNNNGTPPHVTGKPGDAGSHPSSSMSGHPSSSTSGHPSNTMSGHPSNTTSGHPSNTMSGHPSNTTSGHPQNASAEKAPAKPPAKAPAAKPSEKPKSGGDDKSGGDAHKPPV